MTRNGHNVVGVLPEFELAWRRARLAGLDPGMLKWRDEADVIARPNDTRYGLGASVWGKDLDAVQRIGRQIQAGTVWLNEVHQYTPHQVFGGHKQSGIGAENSLHGLGEYTNWQSIMLNEDPDAV